MSEFDKNKVITYINKWLPLLERIDSDVEFKERCKTFDAYLTSEDNDNLLKDLDFYSFNDEAYESGIVISAYNNYTDKLGEDNVHEPSDEFISKLSLVEIVACIAWHFRADHWDNGSLIHESFASGALLKLFKAFRNKAQ